MKLIIHDQNFDKLNENRIFNSEQAICPSLKLSLYLYINDVLKGPLFLMTIFLNSYFLYLVLTTKDLRKSEYFLVSVQSLGDLILTGFINFGSYLLGLWLFMTYFCSCAGLMDFDEHKLSPLFCLC